MNRNTAQMMDAVTKNTKPLCWLGEALRQILLFPALQLVAPLEVKGLENLAGEGSFIFAPNHSSHLDAPLLLAALPLHLRMRVRVAAAADYFFNTGWKGAAVSVLLNAFPFVRKGPNRAISLIQSQQILSDGDSLIIFPEGTRTPDGQLQPFKRGVGYLAMGQQVRVVPVWIEGTRAVMPKGARFPQRHPVTITFGPALRFAPGSDPSQVATAVERQVRVLSQTLRQAA